MSEYIKKDDILSAAVEVEYLGRRRMMVSVSKVDELPVIEIVRCNGCKHWVSDGGAMMFCENTDGYTMGEDFCSHGEVENEQMD